MPPEENQQNKKTDALPPCLNLNRRVLPIIPDAPEVDFRRFVRVLAQTDSPPQVEDLQSGNRIPETLEDVYDYLTRILEFVERYETQRKELLQRLRVKKEEEKRRKDEEDEKNFLSHYAKILRKSRRRQRSSKRKKKPAAEGHPSRLTSPMREDLIESRQRGVYVPAGAIVHPPMRHYVSRDNHSQPAQEQARNRPMLAAGPRPREISPNAEQRRIREAVRIPEEPVREMLLPDGQHNDGFMAIIRIPLDDLDMEPSRLMLNNLRGMIEHEMRVIEARNPILAAHFISNPQMRAPNLRVREEDERGDATMGIHTRRRELIAAWSIDFRTVARILPRPQPQHAQRVMVQPTPRAGQTQPLKKSPLVLSQAQPSSPPLKNPLPPHLRRQERNQFTPQRPPANYSNYQLPDYQPDLQPTRQPRVAPQRNAISPIRRQEREPVAEPPERDEPPIVAIMEPVSNYSSDEQSASSLMMVSDTSNTLVMGDRNTISSDEGCSVGDLMQVSSFEKSPSMIGLKSDLSVTDYKLNEPKQGIDPRYLQARLDSLNTFHSRPSVSTPEPSRYARHETHEDRCERRLDELQHHLEQIERDFGRAATADRFRAIVMERLHSSWRRMADVWEYAERERRRNNYNDTSERRRLFLAHRDLEDQCLLNEQRLSRALRDANDADRRTASLEREMALLQEHQARQLECLESKLEDALKANRSLTEIIEERRKKMD